MPVLDNARHERFAQELAKGSSQTDAYLAAGYRGDKTAASRLSTNVNVQQRVAELKTAVAQMVVIDEAYVLSTIKDTVERCRQAEPVRDRKGDMVLTETPTGDLAPAYTFNSTSVLKGAELLGKHIGMFKERVEHTGKDGGPIILSNRERAKKLLALIAKARAESKAQPTVN